MLITAIEPLFVYESPDYLKNFASSKTFINNRGLFGHMHILKVPFSAGSLGKSLGAEEAPLEIEKKVGDIFLNENGEHTELSFSEVQVESANIEETNKNIYDAVLKKGASSLILLGGDHSITYASFRAFAKTHKNAGIVVFDAHPDLENNFSPPTHEDYLRVLIEEEIVKPENVILVGIRSAHKEESDFIKSSKIKTFPMKEIMLEGSHEVCDTLMTLARNFGALYLSIDIDVLDPAFAPAVAYPEPGGLTSRELIYFVQRLKVLPNLKMADIVEAIPKKDSQGLTIAAAAKILKELC